MFLDYTHICISSIYKGEGGGPFLVERYIVVQLPYIIPFFVVNRLRRSKTICSQSALDAGTFSFIFLCAYVLILRTS
jgi:hypothetical protein